MQRPPPATPRCRPWPLRCQPSATRWRPWPRGWPEDPLAWLRRNLRPTKTDRFNSRRLRSFTEKYGAISPQHEPGDQRVVRVDREQVFTGAVRRSGDLGDNGGTSAGVDGAEHGPGERAADDGVVPQHGAGGQAAVGGEDREPGAGARAAWGPVDLAVGEDRHVALAHQALGAAEFVEPDGAVDAAQARVGRVYGVAGVVEGPFDLAAEHDEVCEVLRRDCQAKLGGGQGRVDRPAVGHGYANLAAGGGHRHVAGYHPAGDVDEVDGDHARVFAVHPCR